MLPGPYALVGITSWETGCVGAARGRGRGAVVPSASGRTLAGTLPHPHAPVGTTHPPEKPTVYVTSQPRTGYPTFLPNPQLDLRFTSKFQDQTSSRNTGWVSRKLEAPEVESGNRPGAEGHTGS